MTKPRLNSRAMMATEDQVQAAVAEHLRFFAAPGVVWTHVPNGGMRSKAVAGRLKAHGVRAGWPDILLVAMGKAYALELKTLTGKTSGEQQQCLSDLHAAGAEIAVAHGVDAALVQLHDWGLLTATADRLLPIRQAKQSRARSVASSQPTAGVPDDRA